MTAGRTQRNSTTKPTTVTATSFYDHESRSYWHFFAEAILCLLQRYSTHNSRKKFILFLFMALKQGSGMRMRWWCWYDITYGDREWRTNQTKDSLQAVRMSEPYGQLSLRSSIVTCETCGLIWWWWRREWIGYTSISFTCNNSWLAWIFPYVYFERLTTGRKKRCWRAFPEKMSPESLIAKCEISNVNFSIWF